MEGNLHIRESGTVEEGVERLLEYTRRQPREKVRLSEAAGRILADDFYSLFPIPSFRKSAMDGYAVRFSDIEQVSADRPVELQAIEEIRAGMVNLPTSGHSAVRIFTGAPLPEPYDTVVMQEAVLAPEDDAPTVRFSIPTERGKHIADIGEDIPQGTCVLEKGTVLSAKEIAILASFGTRDIEVSRNPHAAVIQERAAAPAGREQFVARGVIDDRLATTKEHKF